MGHIISKAQPEAAIDTIQSTNGNSLTDGEEYTSSGQDADVPPSTRRTTACLVEEMAAIHHKSAELMLDELQQLRLRVEDMHDNLQHCAEQIDQQSHILADLIADLDALQDVVMAYATDCRPRIKTESKADPSNNGETSCTMVGDSSTSIETSHDQTIDRLCAVETSMRSIQAMVQKLVEREHPSTEGGVPQDNAPHALLVSSDFSAQVEQSLPPAWSDTHMDVPSVRSPVHVTSSPRIAPHGHRHVMENPTAITGFSSASPPASVQTSRGSLFGENNLSRRSDQKSGPDGVNGARSLLSKRKASAEIEPTRLRKDFATIITSDCALATAMLQAKGNHSKPAQATKLTARRSGRDSKPNMLRVRPIDTQIDTSDSIAELELPGSSQIHYGALYGDHGH